MTITLEELTRKPQHFFPCNFKFRKHEWSDWLELPNLSFVRTGTHWFGRRCSKCGHQQCRSFERWRLLLPDWRGPYLNVSKSE